MTKYVLGFAFSSDCQQVLLIKKDHPPWQAGKLNGIGGHIEVGETPTDAMYREAFEETDQSNEFGWQRCGIMGSYSWKVEVFGCRVKASDITINKTMLSANEPCNWYDVYALPKNIIPNLKWLVPMCASAIYPGCGIKHFAIGEKS